MIAKYLQKEGYPLRKTLPLLGLSWSSFYYQPKAGSRGRKPSGKTRFKDREEWVDDSHILERIEWLLQQEFIDYGYKKVTIWLQRNEGFAINKKKVYRLMKQKKWLSNRMHRDRSGKVFSKELLQKSSRPLEALQTDLKYIYIAGEHRNAMLISILDVHSRAVLGYYLGWSIRNEQVQQVLGQVMARYQLAEKVTLRTDNGSQFEAKDLREFLAEMKIDQEFTHVASPEQNCYIESYHSIIEREVSNKYEFGSLAEADKVISRYLDFYNRERIHSGIAYRSPNEVLQESDIELYSFVSAKPAA